MNNQKNILIVEDEVVISSYLKMLLEDEGYEVCGSFTTGEEAVEFVHKTKPDLILMDINLVGKMDGIEAAAIIKETSEIPIVYMTGFDRSDFEERANKTEPIAFLSKPVEIWDLKPIFESIFG